MRRTVIVDGRAQNVFVESRMMKKSPLRMADGESTVSMLTRPIPLAKTPFPSSVTAPRERPELGVWRRTTFSLNDMPGVGVARSARDELVPETNALAETPSAAMTTNRSTLRAADVMGGSLRRLC